MNMTSQIASLSRGWIARYEAIQRHGEQSPEALATFQAFEQFEGAVAQDPELAWQAILNVLEQSENEFVLENLAAGPLETLIGRHAAGFIDRVEQRARVDERFRWLLGGVWQGLIPQEFWQRVERAQGDGANAQPDA